MPVLTMDDGFIFSFSIAQWVAQTIKIVVFCKCQFKLTHRPIIFAWYSGWLEKSDYYSLFSQWFFHKKKHQATKSLSRMQSRQINLQTNPFCTFFGLWQRLRDKCHHNSQQWNGQLNNIHIESRLIEAKRSRALKKSGPYRMASSYSWPFRSITRVFTP